MMPSCFRAGIYARRRGRICQLPKNAKLVAKLLEAVFFHLPKKKKYAKLKYQTLGDAYTLSYNVYNGKYPRFNQSLN